MGFVATKFVLVAAPVNDSSLLLSTSPFLPITSISLVCCTNYFVPDDDIFCHNMHIFRVIPFVELQNNT